MQNIGAELAPVIKQGQAQLECHALAAWRVSQGGSVASDGHVEGNA